MRAFKVWSLGGFIRNHLLKVYEFHWVSSPNEDVPRGKSIRQVTQYTHADGKHMFYPWVFIPR